MTDVKHHNNFNLIRLMAAAQVFYVHSLVHLDLATSEPDWLKVLTSLFPGVAIFFLISGFLIAGSYLKPSTRLPTYFANRALRIYPALWVNLAVLLALLGVTGSLAYFPWTLNFWAWVAVAFPTGSDWFALQAVGDVMNYSFFPYFPSGVLWTIPVELSFYILVPVIFAKQLEKRKLIGWSLLVWGLVSLIVYWHWELRSHPQQIAKYLWFFLLGAAIKVYWEKLQPLLAGKALFWLGAYVALGWLSYLENGPYYYAIPSFSSVMLTLFLAAAVFSFAHTAPSLSKWLSGHDLSYGLYLWHMPVIWVLAEFGYTGRWRHVALAGVLSIILALLSWLCVERPALRLKNRSSAKVPPKTAGAAETASHQLDSATRFQVLSATQT